MKSQTPNKIMARTTPSFKKTLRIASLLLTGAILLYSAYSAFQTYQESQNQNEDGSIDTCFSMSEDCSSKLEGLINNATSAKGAVYSLTEPNILSALKNKNADVLVDEDNYDGYGTKISITGLMHNKFFVLTMPDGKKYVVTGSTNPTKNSFHKDDNNMVIIQSNILAKNFEEEFDEIKYSRKRQKTTNTKIYVNGTLIENYFCPEDDCEQHVVDTLTGAKQSILFLAYSFTSDNDGKAIAAKKDILPNIRGVFDKTEVASNRNYSEYYRLKDNGISVKIENSTGLLHHKVFIVDGSVVETGSANPTSSGYGKNKENIIIIHNSEIAKRFTEEFERVWTKN